VLDANTPSRMRDMESAIAESRATKLVIDHHQDPKPFVDVYAVDVESSSTCELIARLQGSLEAASGQKLSSKAFAEAVYTGIMTDTGHFRFPRTDAELHRIIASLVEAGADPTYIYEQVMNQNPIQRSRLLGRALSGLQLFHGGALCLMTVSANDMQQTEANEDMIEGFVEQTLSLQGVQAGALVVELPEYIKISLRSKGALAVNQIAAEFGGGGHLNAAGCRTREHSFEQVQRIIIAQVGALLAGTVPS
jgi:bifunctional oligoribonuclease and PAP phosphatase NrnA